MVTGHTNMISPLNVHTDFQFTLFSMKRAAETSIQEHSYYDKLNMI